MDNNKNRKPFTAIWLVLAVCCVLYGIRIWMIHSGTKFYAVWYAAGLFFLFLAFVSKKSLWEKVPKKLRTAVYIAVSLLLVLFIAVECLIMTDFFDKGEDDLDYIIVLGAQVREDGPSYVLKKRLDAALDYLERNPETKCIVSGGQGYNEPFPEAQGMAEYLTLNGIDGERITMEDRSTSTEENIRNSMRFIQEGASVGVVTNNFHVFRAVRTAERCGLKNVCGIAGKTSPLYLPNNMLREFFAVVKFALTGL